MKRILKRLASLLLCVVLCVGTVVPLTGAAFNKIFTIALMTDKGTVTVEAIVDDGVTNFSVEDIVNGDGTDAPVERIVAGSEADLSDEDISESDMADISEDTGENTLFDTMLAEAEKHLGIPYVWAGSAPSTGFDCSGFVSWVLNHSGWNVGRLGAQALYDICVSIPLSSAQPGDLVFFTKTYRAPRPVTHVGIYTGDGTMIHCGSSAGVTYSKLDNSYWRQHYYGAGRLPLQYVSDGGIVNA